MTSSYKRSGGRTEPTLSVDVQGVASIHLTKRSFIYRAISAVYTQETDQRRALVFFFNKKVLLPTSSIGADTIIVTANQRAESLDVQETTFLHSRDPKLLVLHQFVYDELSTRYKCNREKKNASMRRLRNGRKPPRRDYNILYIGMERPGYVRNIETLYQEATKLPSSLRQRIRDEARIVATENDGIQRRVYTVNRNPTNSRFHYDMDLTSYRRAKPFPPELIFNEVYVDYIWMPSEYLLGIISRDFCQSFLPDLASGRMPKGGRVYLPLSFPILQRIFENWTPFLECHFLLRFLRPDQEEEMVLKRVTDSLDLKLLGKDDGVLPNGVLRSEVEELLETTCVTKPSLLYELLPLCFPDATLRCRFLCLSRREASDVPEAQPANLVNNSRDQVTCPFCHLYLRPRRMCCQSLSLRSPARSAVERAVKTDWWTGVIPDDDEDNQSCDDGSSCEWQERETKKDRVVKPPSNPRHNDRPTKAKMMQGDHDAVNRTIEKEMKMADSTSGPKGTLAILPRDQKMSSTMLRRNFRLANEQLIKSNFGPESYWVEKSDKISCTLWFGLREKVHTVSGRGFLEEFAKRYNITPEIMANNVDHLFLNSNRPCVINTHDVAGIQDKALGSLIKMPASLLGCSYLVQLDWAMDSLLSHADEMIDNSSIDSFRNVIAQHNGSCPRAGQSWKRANGVGVATPGLFASSKILSDSYRSALFRLNVIAHHQILEIMVGHLAEYDRQSRNDNTRLKVVKEWLDFLLPVSLSLEQRNLCTTGLRISDAVSVLIGSAYLHFDSMNGAKVGHSDQVTVVTKQIDWRNHVKREENISKLLSSQVPLVGSSVTVVNYGRSINDSQAAQMEGLADIDDPLIKEMMALNEVDFWQDASKLDQPQHFQRFSENLNPRMTVGYDYPFQHQAIPESANRSWYIGSFVNVWARFVRMYSPVVTFRHTASFVAFITRECNGQTLIIGLMEQELNKGRRVETETILRDLRVEALYEWLSLQVIGNRGHSGVISCKDFRYQKIDRMLFDVDTKGLDKSRKDCGLFICFLTSQFELLNGNQQSQQEALQMLTSAEYRKQKLGKRVTENIQLGCVRLSVGIQLAACLMLIPLPYATWAMLTKGSSGFYKAVEYLAGESTGDSLSTSEANAIANKTISVLRRHSVYATMSWLDQCCCLFHRWQITEDDRRKKDLILWSNDGALYTPIRVKEGTKKTWIQFLSKERQWESLENAIGRFVGDWNGVATVDGGLIGCI